MLQVAANQLADDRGRSDGKIISNGYAAAVRPMLEAGFEVNKYTHLAEVFTNLASWHLSQLSGSLNIELGRSTIVIGIADPIGCLQPNEIHLQFSSSFTDNASGTAYNFLYGTEALTGRHPSLRRSDIQKVRATFKMELRHLVDVVVFPRTGTYPLAGKLQGGDYDGDTFWVCWEPSIVEPFCNAPVPLDTTDPESVGIKVDRTTVEDISQQPDSLLQFFKQSFNFAWQSSYLGISTNFHTKLCYNLNSVGTKEAEAVADVHDHLVDSAKNGYTYDQEAWEAFQKSLQRMPERLFDPAYKAAPERDLQQSKDDSDVRYNPKHVIDYLVYRVARRDARKILESIKQRIFASSTDEDESVSGKWLSYAARPEIAAEVRRMGDELNAVYQKWPRPIMIEGKSAEEKRKLFNDAKVLCRELYQKKQPLACTQGPTWSQDHISHIPTEGELVKAAAAFHLFSRKGAFMFAVAGPHVLFLKAFSRDIPYVCVPLIFEKLKMKKLDGIATVEQGEYEDGIVSEYTVAGTKQDSTDSDEFHSAHSELDEEMDTDE